MKLMDILLEDRSKGWLTYLMASKAPAPQSWGVKTIGEAGEKYLEFIVKETIPNLVPNDLSKYREYLAKQIASGKMPIEKLEEDKERFIKTLRLFKLLSKKAIWKGPTDIMQYKSWRGLENITLKVAREHGYDEEESVGYDKKENDSIILYKKEYGKVDEAMSELFGSEEANQNAKTFYLRKILTLEGSCKYGKGTQWCTSSTPPHKKLFGDDAKKKAEPYKDWDDYKEQGLKPEEIKAIKDYLAGKTDWIYNHEYFSSFMYHYILRGLFIIEAQTASYRKPVLQWSLSEWMTAKDQPITSIGKRPKQFLLEALKSGAITKDDLGRKGQTLLGI